MKMTTFVHGLFDYGIFIFLLFAPSVLKLTHIDALAVFSLGFIYLVFTVVTHYSAGLISLIDLEVHGWVEFILSIALLSSSYFFEGFFSHLTLKVFFGLGTVLIWIWVFSDYTNESMFKRIH